MPNEGDIRGKGTGWEIYVGNRWIYVPDGDADKRALLEIMRAAREIVAVPVGGVIAFDALEDALAKVSHLE